MLQIIHLPQHVNLCGPEAALPTREVEVNTAGSGRRARRVRLLEAESLREVVLRAGADALVEGTGHLVRQNTMAEQNGHVRPHLL